MEQSPGESDRYSTGHSSPHVMKTKRSLLCSQQPATDPCPEPDKSIPHLAILFLQPMAWPNRDKIYCLNELSMFSCQIDLLGVKDYNDDSKISVGLMYVYIKA
jgi:hypothetical protein